MNMRDFLHELDGLIVGAERENPTMERFVNQLKDLLKKHLLDSEE